MYTTTSAKIPDEIDLGIKTTLTDVDSPNLSAMGGIFIQKYFTKNNVKPFTARDFDIQVKNGKVWLLLSAQGKKHIKIRTKSQFGEDVEYFNRVIKSFKEGYRDYVNKKENKTTAATKVNF